MMYQVMFDRLAVFDDLITHTACRPKCRADSNRRSNRSNLFHFRVVMMPLVVVPFMNPRVTHAVMMMLRGEGFRYEAQKQQACREN
jgi:hypothetical protein